MRKTLTESKIYGHLMEVLKNVYLASNEMIEIERRGNLKSEIMEKLIPGSGVVFEHNVTLTNAIEAALEEIELLKQIIMVPSVPINVVLEIPEVLEFVSFLEMITDPINTSMELSVTKEISNNRDSNGDFKYLYILKYAKLNSNIYEFTFYSENDQSSILGLSIISCYGSKKYSLTVEDGERNFNVMVENDVIVRHAVKETLVKFLEIIDSCITKKNPDEIEEDEDE